MGTSKITVNGQQYDSPDAMPPDVRRIYDEAMRAVGPALAGGQTSDSTQVLGGQLLPGVKGNVVIHRTITVNNQTMKNIDELTPELRQRVQAGLQQAGGAAGEGAKAGFHVSLNLGRPDMRTVYDPGGTTPAMMRPIEPGSLSPGARRFIGSLIFWVVVGLLAFAFLEYLTLHITIR